MNIICEVFGVNIIKPSYYDDFKCIGNECKESCCKGWEIHIDKRSYNAYRNVKGEYYKKLKDGIKRNRKDPDDLHYAEMKLEEMKCKFLNNDNLCDIYINLGEEYLCNICKTYPRKVSKNGKVYEKTLMLSCPEVARMLVELKHDFSFNMEKGELNKAEREFINPIREFKYDEKLYGLLWKGRELSIDVAQFKEIDIWKRLVFIKIIGDELQKVINEKNYDNIDKTIDNLRNIVTDYNVITDLDNIEQVNQIKIEFIRVLIGRKRNANNSEKFLKLICDFDAMFEKVSQDEFEVLEREFNAYFKEYEKILENYIVYSLYNNYMNPLYTYEELNRSLLFLILSYSTIKVLLISRWNKNNKILSKDDIIEVLYSFSRHTEHNSSFIKSLYEDLKKEGYTSLAYLTILVR